MNTESAVITAVCNNKDIATVLADNIDEVFVSHRDVWEGLKSYYLKFKGVPDVSVLQERFKDFEPVSVKGETAYYLEQLKNEYLAGRIRNLLLSSGASLKTNASARVVADMQKELSTLTKLTSNVRDVDLTDFKLAAKHFEAVKNRSDAMGGSPGIMTGFKAIDYAYPTGMAPGHLIVMIGWPGRGKTWMSSYLACKAWEQGFKPMIISLEMTPENMRDRIYTMLGSGLFKASDFSRGQVDISAFDDWGAKKFADKNQFILVSNEGTGQVTPNTVQAKIDQHKPDLVILDYHQLFNDSSGAKSEVERNRNISRDFKLLAVRNNIPIIDITAATMDDVSDQDSPPMLSQVAWSKAIEYDADMAMAIHRTPDTNIIEVVSRKNRHGTEFGFFLDWDLNRGIIKEVYEQPMT
ncbi:DnaB Replicative DNA helicase [uncultured Caudovirales phage]|jgi:replicative DNA helicase|uniref:DnaB Replicative DNA helicase n=1 Tax=uncultured Caudovirales phage TaxID=2100421 RepID=A0A6J5R981_9CAUD|nr:DnaB Replicative DNA helicase [uncultured Caudovirales phage]CAB4193563.1 DnaB Replicative DNA helicase [uncultured Caudovirales phage]